MIQDRKYPKRPVVSVHAIIFQKGKVLLVKRANQPNKGFWSVPGGVIELGETIEQAVKREVREESNIDIEPSRIVNVLDSIVKDQKGNIQFHFTVIYMLARYLGGRAKPSSDALKIRWTKRNELEELKMVPRTRDLIKEALKKTDDQ